MNQKIKVSIIIPVYKVEPYIVRCIESVLCQTYRDLEVILIDDCSPDRSMELAKECIGHSPSSNDLSIVYLKHDHNRGLSAARNSGLDVGTGEYVYFLDSDDALVNDAIEVMVGLAKKYHHPEMIIGSIQVEGNRKDLGSRIYQYGYYEGNEKIRGLYQQGIPYMMACNKLIRIDFITNNHLRFVEGIIHEDNPWSFFIANRLCSMVVSSHITYIYYLRPDSIMGVMSSRQKMNRYNSLLTIIKEYDNGFADGRLIGDEKAQIFYTRLKYDTIYEIIRDKNVPFSFKARSMKKIFNSKWKFNFIYLFAELEVKTCILNTLNFVGLKRLPHDTSQTNNT